MNPELSLATASNCL
uniref:Uncharacterized protein n=1 Tax=Anguilla anguilla TaxID=7936 RepID=A0A0E9RDW0_ANGAN